MGQGGGKGADMKGAHTGGVSLQQHYLQEDCQRWIGYVWDAFDELEKCRLFLSWTYPYYLIQFCKEFYFIEKWRATRDQALYQDEERVDEDRAQFEQLQAQLESDTEALSDVLARNRLRANRHQLSLLTRAMKLRRVELESLIITHLQANDDLADELNEDPEELDEKDDGASVASSLSNISEAYLRKSIDPVDDEMKGRGDRTHGHRHSGRRHHRKESRGGERDIHVGSRKPREERNVYEKEHTRGSSDAYGSAQGSGTIQATEGIGNIDTGKGEKWYLNQNNLMSSSFTLTYSPGKLITTVCTILYYTVLYCTILYYTILYCTSSSSSSSSTSLSWRKSSAESSAWRNFIGG